MRVNKSFIFSYLTMRKTIGILGISLPFMVVLFGFLGNGLTIRGSISIYYYTNARDIYIGMLSVISLFLISYRGYEKIDDIAGNLSGLFALGILLFPTSINLDFSAKVGLFLLNDRISDIFHMTFAALFFFSLSFTSIFLFTKTNLVIVSKAKRRRNFIYITCGIIMLVSIISIIIYLIFLQKTFLSKLRPVLVLESIALISFGISWLVKGNRFLKDRKIKY